MGEFKIEPEWAASEWTVPEWANWSGDPFYDNYSHIEPGAIGRYSSGGMWRLAQPLTALWNRDLKEVLDEKLFSKIMIPSDRWDWLPREGSAARQELLSPVARVMGLSRSSL